MCCNGERTSNGTNIWHEVVLVKLWFRLVHFVQVWITISQSNFMSNTIAFPLPMLENTFFFHCSTCKIFDPIVFICAVCVFKWWIMQLHFLIWFCRKIFFKTVPLDCKNPGLLHVLCTSLNHNFTRTTSCQILVPLLVLSPLQKISFGKNQMRKCNCMMHHCDMQI
jgi:hypothetical protein